MRLTIDSGDIVKIQKLTPENAPGRGSCQRLMGIFSGLFAKDAVNLSEHTHEINGDKGAHVSKW